MIRYDDDNTGDGKSHTCADHDLELSELDQSAERRPYNPSISGINKAAPLGGVGVFSDMSDEVFHECVDMNDQLFTLTEDEIKMLDMELERLKRTGAGPSTSGVLQRLMMKKNKLSTKIGSIITGLKQNVGDLPETAHDLKSRATSVIAQAYDKLKGGVPKPPTTQDVKSKISTGLGKFKNGLLKLKHKTLHLDVEAPLKAQQLSSPIYEPYRVTYEQPSQKTSLTTPTTISLRNEPIAALDFRRVAIVSHKEMMRDIRSHNASFPEADFLAISDAIKNRTFYDLPLTTMRLVVVTNPILTYLSLGETTFTNNVTTVTDNCLFYDPVASAVLLSITTPELTSRLEEVHHHSPSSGKPPLSTYTEEEFNHNMELDIAFAKLTNRVRTMVETEFTPLYNTLDSPAMSVLMRKYTPQFLFDVIQGHVPRPAGIHTFMPSVGVNECLVQLNPTGLLAGPVNMLTSKLSRFAKLSPLPTEQVHASFDRVDAVRLLERVESSAAHNGHKMIGWTPVYVAMSSVSYIGGKVNVANWKRYCGVVNLEMLDEIMDMQASRVSTYSEMHEANVARVHMLITKYTHLQCDYTMDLPVAMMTATLATHYQRVAANTVEFIGTGFQWSPPARV